MLHLVGYVLYLVKHATLAYEYLRRLHSMALEGYLPS